MSNLKKLRVCLSKDFPVYEDRNPNYIYFLYDKLEVFVGQAPYHDHYVICEKIPSDPVVGILYFDLSDGYAKVYSDYIIKKVAKVENDEQLDILKDAGTMFFVNSEKRYLDLQRRIITLPYQNGTYELTVSLANNLKIDKNTVIAYNTETNQFEITGNINNADIIFGNGYYGAKGKTADITVSDHKISAEVKLSPAYDNMLKFVADGLYANATDRVTKKEFDSWKNRFQEYKISMEKYLKDLESQIGQSADIVNEETINKKIHEALVDVYPTIDAALASFNKMASQFEGIEERVKTYTNSSINTAKNELYEAIVEATTDPWEDFTNVATNVVKSTSLDSSTDS